MKKMLFFILIVLVFIQIQVFAEGSRETDAVQNGREVRKDDCLFSWEINDELLTVTMSAPASGWIAIGFSPTSVMKDANIIIAYVKKGEVFYRDDYGDSLFSHKPDTEGMGENNITEVSGFEENKKTSVTFTIPLDSGDKRDKALVAGKSYKVIMAFSNKDDFNARHTQRFSFIASM
jgi:hypothetical protein